MKITQLISKVSNLDTYSQLSVFGSWSFTANASAINQAIRYIPDGPVTGGIEEYTAYEAARRHALRELETSQLPAFIALSREIGGMIENADGQTRGIADTFQFMADNGPKRDTFGNDYDQRVRMGLKPGMTRKQFIDAEFEVALKRHAELVAKGEDACRLCDTIDVPEGRTLDDLPDWVSETFERKMLEKLHARWLKLEMVRTSPRRQKQVRDSAAADQRLIEQLLEEFGETPGYEDLEGDDQDRIDADHANVFRSQSPVSAVDKLLAHQRAKSLIDMPNDSLDDPRKPGVVTVTKFVRAPAPTE